MKIEIQETTKRNKIIDVTLPYYYKHEIDLDNDDCDIVIIYGKIEDGKYTSISEKERGSDLEYGLEIRKLKSFTYLSEYFSDKYKGSEAEFLSAKSRFLSALNNI